MTQISASDVGKLRRQTGSGMMDCKKALIEANGDFDHDYLKQQRQLTLWLTQQLSKKLILPSNYASTSCLARNSAKPCFAPFLANL